MKKLIYALIPAVLLFINSTAQQIKTPAPSPPQYVKQDFGLSAIELSYSRPGVKNRKVFGDLVPYGKVWRTGANQATTLTFGDDVSINDTKIPAGKYGLLTIPDAGEWTIIITKQLDVTNPAAYKQDQDVVRVKIKSYDLPFTIENFTILFSNVTPTSCNLEMMWDKSFISLPIKTEIDSKIMTQIDAAAGKADFPYFTAAGYYLENGKDLNKALDWFNKAIEKEPKAYYIYYQKARCQAKLGKKQDAVTTSQKSIELAKEAKNDDYVALNEKLLASLK